MDSNNKSAKENKPSDELRTGKYSQIRVPSGFDIRVKQLTQISQTIAKSYVPVIDTFTKNILASSHLYDQLAETRKVALEAVNKMMEHSGLLSSLQEIAKTTAKLARGLDAHFPDNWPKGKLSECGKICMQGIPIVFVPRQEIVTQILKAKDVTKIKQLIVRKDVQIIEDCESALADASWLTNDMKDHIQSSIQAYKDGNYRAAQSTISVAFDVLMESLIDMRTWRKNSGKTRALSSSKVRQLADEFSGDLMKLPLSRAPFYTLFMFPIIGNILAQFELDNKSTYTNDANRHMGIHTVSSQQYKRSNALLLIMTVTSICKITELRGKYWLQLSAKEYGVPM